MGDLKRFKNRLQCLLGREEEAVFSSVGQLNCIAVLDVSSPLGPIVAAACLKFAQMQLIV